MNLLLQFKGPGRFSDASLTGATGDEATCRDGLIGAHAFSEQLTSIFTEMFLLLPLSTEVLLR